MKKLLSRNRGGQSGSALRVAVPSPGMPGVGPCIIALYVLLAGCVHTAVDKPLHHWSPGLGQTTEQEIDANDSPELVVLLGFSGGGTRASAFSYGVLKELANTPMSTGHEGRTLLDEVDIISSVSGGSFTAAYYGLYGEKIFSDFEDKFLRKDIEAILLEKMLNPVNWVKLMSQTYGRSDLAAEYYGAALFDNASLADLGRPDAPLIVMNSTNLATGDRFPFMRNTFDMICADFTAYPVARAVAASSAVPVILSPVTLENFAGTCGFQAPGWQVEALQDQQLTPRKKEALIIQDYLDAKKRPWLHLVDGGVSDNLGLREFYNALNQVSAPDLTSAAARYPDARHVLMVSVNAHAKHRSDWMLERYAPSLFEMLGSVSADQISRYSDDTIQLVQYRFESWVRSVSTPERPVTFHFVEVSFNEVADENERNFLGQIDTNFSLNDEQVNRLIAAAGKVLRESGAFQDFLGVADRPGR